MTLVEHHIKYKEIHGEDKTVWMEIGDHRRLHYLLRQEGKCNLPAELLNKMTSSAHQRAKKQREKQYYSLKGKIKLIINNLAYRIQCASYLLYLKTYLPIPICECSDYSESDYILPKEEYMSLDGCSDGFAESTYLQSSDPVKTRDKVIEILKDSPNLNTAEKAEKLGVSERTIQRHIKELKKQGKI